MTEIERTLWIMFCALIVGFGAQWVREQRSRFRQRQESEKLTMSVIAVVEQKTDQLHAVVAVETEKLHEAIKENTEVSTKAFHEANTVNLKLEKLGLQQQSIEREQLDAKDNLKLKT